MEKERQKKTEREKKENLQCVFTISIIWVFTGRGGKSGLQTVARHQCQESRAVQHAAFILHMILRRSYPHLYSCLGFQRLGGWGIIASYSCGVESTMRAGVGSAAFTARAPVSVECLAQLRGSLIVFEKKIWKT